MKFELDKLTSYTDECLISEINRVSCLVPGKVLKSCEFNKLSKVHSSTLRRRFGSWNKALAAAGLQYRFDSSSEAYTREEIIDLLQSIAAGSGRKIVTLDECEISSKPIHRLFGSFKNALKAAGLFQSSHAIRYTDEECFENMLTVWTALGRQPIYREINQPPSVVRSKAYVLRWGSWRRALAAFVERVNQDSYPEVDLKRGAFCRRQ